MSQTSHVPPDAASPGALAALRVLDLSRVLAGPLCTMVLGDLGAEVIKVERPDSGDDTRHWGPPWAEAENGNRESAYYLCANRNKRSIEADFNDLTDREHVRDLAVAADVLVENFAPDTLAQFGLGYDQLAAANPRLIYCSITGYGSAGPDAGRPGYDFAVQARAGWMSVTGEPEGAAMKAGFALVDVLTGLNAAVAVLAALRERERSGRGQRIEVSLLDSALAGLINVAQAALVTGHEPVRYGNAHPTIVPYQMFHAADRPFVVAVGNDAQWSRLCHAAGMPNLAQDVRFSTNPARIQHRDEVTTLLAALFRALTAAEWLDRLDAAGVPCAPVQSVREALADPAFTERGGLWRMDGSSCGTVATVASPLRLQRTPPSLRYPAPALGEHTSRIREAGWEAET